MTEEISEIPFREDEGRKSMAEVAAELGVNSSTVGRLVKKCETSELKLHYEKMEKNGRKSFWFDDGQIEYLKKLRNIDSNEKQMTTRELASTLGVSEKTVKRAAALVSPGRTVLSKFASMPVKGGSTLLFDEQQATEVKKEIQKHHNLASRQIDTVTTEAEENEILAKGWAILQQRSAYYERILREKNQQIEELEPKALEYDTLADRTYCKNFRDTAAYLGMSQTEFMNILKSKYIYKTPRGEYRAYAPYSVYFELKAFSSGEITGNQLVVSLKGLQFFRENYGRKAC